jgi:hypothetical protein
MDCFSTQFCSTPAGCSLIQSSFHAVCTEPASQVEDSVSDNACPLLPTKMQGCFLCASHGLAVNQGSIYLLEQFTELRETLYLYFLAYCKVFYKDYCKVFYKEQPDGNDAWVKVWEKELPGPLWVLPSRNLYVFSYLEAL